MITLKRPDGNRPDDFHLSRRGVAAAIFAGYAVARPLAADADPVTTDAVGLVTETVMLPTAGKPIRGYIARPDGPGRFPAVIVVNEIFGLHAYIRDVCRRLAKIGYVAIAPGFFDRAGDPAPLPMSQMADIRKIVVAASDAQVMGDVGTTLKYLESRPYVAARSLAITGFCWGGKAVWNACETYRRFQGRRLLVRPDGAAGGRRARPGPSEALADRACRGAEMSGARPLWRQGCAQRGRAGHARGAGGGRQDHLRNRRL